jgi:sulfate transport system ATP-binding protein
VTRLVRVGFEVRLTVRTEQDDEVSVVITRAESRSLELDTGTRVWLSPNRGVTPVSVMPRTATN